MTETVFRKMSYDEPTLVVLMNILFDAGATAVAVAIARTYLAEAHLECFQTAEANAVMATMLLHMDNIVDFTNFQSAVRECGDATDLLWLNLQRNLANWQFRHGMFVRGKQTMQDPGFYSRHRPLSEKHADRLVSCVGRLLEGDTNAVSLLVRLYDEARRKTTNRTYLRNIRWWLILALCLVGRDDEAAPLALDLLGKTPGSLVGPDPKRERQQVILVIGKLRTTRLRQLAAYYAISKYRL